jgi:hypothetical protein
MQGTFVGNGVAILPGTDRLSWRAVVAHEQLNSSIPASITGGTLTATSSGNGGTSLVGTFNGGSLAYDAVSSSKASCGSQVYKVHGTLQFSPGSGTFDAVLTHYRMPMLGRCVTYGATVSGSLSVS